MFAGIAPKKIVVAEVQNGEVEQLCLLELRQKNCCC
jgi:hypothetical protein